MRAGFLALRFGLPLLIIACGSDDLLLPGSDSPAALRLVSGDLQEGVTGILLPEPLVVEAVDRTGQPVPGSRILFRFQAATEGARVSPDTAVTNGQGRASAEVRLGDAPGGHPVEAVVVDPESDLAVRFLLTALMRPEPDPPEPDPIDGGGDGDDDGRGGGDDDGGSGGGGGGGGGGGDVDDGGGNGNDDGGGGEADKGKEKGKGRGKDKGGKEHHD